MIEKAFKPALFLKNNHLQTLYPALLNRTKIFDVELEIFELSDGDFVECIWHNKPTLVEKKPISILFHGLAGSFNSSYIKRAMSTLAKSGFAVVLMQFRGCGTKPNRLPRSYHSGDTEDAKEWIMEIRNRYPSNPLFGIGYSLGGNMLLKLLAEFKDKSPLKAAVSISAPLDLEICANKMNSGFSKLYQYHLMRELKKNLLEKYRLFDMESIIGIDKNGVKKLNSFWEFDDIYTAPVHGFKDAKEYYKESSAKQYLKDIKTDTLIIHAKDDPFMTTEILPSYSELSDHITLEVQESGGHVGFVSNCLLKPVYWLENRIMDYFNTINIKESNDR